MDILTEDVKSRKNVDLMMVYRDWNEELFSMSMSSPQLTQGRYPYATKITDTNGSSGRTIESRPPMHDATGQIIRVSSNPVYDAKGISLTNDPFFSDHPESSLLNHAFAEDSSLENPDQSRDPVLTDNEWLMLSDGDHESVVMVVSTAGIIRFISENCQNLVGFAREEILQADLRSFVHPDDYGLMTMEIGYCIQSRKTEFISVVRCITSHRHYMLLDIRGRICMIEKQLAANGPKNHATGFQSGSRFFFILVLRDHGRVCSQETWNSSPNMISLNNGNRRSIPPSLKPQEDPALNCIAEQRQGLFTAYLSLGNLTFSHVSPLCSDYVGYTPLELCQRNLYSFIHQNEASSLTEFCNMIRHNPALSESPHQECAIRFRVKEGFYMWLVLRLSCYNGYRTQVFTANKQVVRLFELKRLNGPPTDISHANGSTIMSIPLGVPFPVGQWIYEAF
jgi:hypothetical protein